MKEKAAMGTESVIRIKKEEREKNETTFFQFD